MSLYSECSHGDTDQDDPAERACVGVEDPRRARVPERSPCTFGKASSRFTRSRNRDRRLHWRLPRVWDRRQRRDSRSRWRRPRMGEWTHSPEGGCVVTRCLIIATYRITCQ